jgi:KipI family sensor histidine kinase inhibitor
MMRALPAGDDGLLMESDVPPAMLAAAITRAGLPGVTDVIPGARTVLVITTPGTTESGDLAAAIAALPVPDAVAGSGLIEIPVRYDGPDLDDVAELTGLAADEVVALHSGAEYTVGWLGFSPGFGYLTGLDRRLSVPRLASPRPRVPAGSVAIAGGLAAVYPGPSPGGWRLLGRTATRMWDPDRVPPSLLSPGQRVRFTPVSSITACAGDAAQGTAGPRAENSGIAPASAAAPSHLAAAGGLLEVVRPGPLATIQDLGRPGMGAVGVPPSGAADAASLVAANRLAGNADSAACVELTLGRATFRCTGRLRLAVAGAPAAVTVSSRPGEAGSQIPFGVAFEVPDGGTVSVGAPAAGLRTYIAVTGGISLPLVLGSSSYDVLSGLGGGPLRPGDLLPAGPASSPVAAPSAGGHAGMAATSFPVRGTPTRLRLIPGPRLDWFGADALAILSGSPYLVTPMSNRTGLRLTGLALPRSGSGELPSEGMVTGSVEVPHDGQPILLLADHPTVGGYPVIAVVARADIGAAAQLRPGEQIQFVVGAGPLSSPGRGNPPAHPLP